MSGLDDTGCLEGLVGAILGNGAHTFGGEDDGHGAVKLRDEDALLLEVRLLADVAGRVELGSTNTVAVAASDLRALLCDRTNLCHMIEIV